MHMTTRFTLVLLAAVVALAGVLPAAAQTPGVTATEIKVGNTNPYSGPASAYGTIGKVIGAYFRKVNDEGGINGRKITYITYDDGYSPPKTVEMVRRTVERFGRVDDESAQFTERAGRVRDAGVRLAMAGRVLFITLPLVGALGTAAVYWLGARQVLSGAITVGTVVAMAAYVQRLYQPLTDLASARVEFMTAFVSFERVFEVLDTPHPIADHPDATELARPAGRLPDMGGIERGAIALGFIAAPESWCSPISDAFSITSSSGSKGKTHST